MDTLTEPTRSNAAPSANTLRMCCLLGELDDEVMTDDKSKTTLKT